MSYENVHRVENGHIFPSHPFKKIHKGVCNRDAQSDSDDRQEKSGRRIELINDDIDDGK